MSIVTYKIGQCEVELHDSGLTVTVFGKASTPAWPEDSDEYRARAQALGYGEDVFRMSREHELLHTLLSVSLGLPHSLTLHSVATGGNGEGGLREEEMVLAAQAFCNQRNIDVLEQFKRMAKRV